VSVNSSLHTVIREITVIVALLGASVSLALTDHTELAATALGGALGIAMPGSRISPVPGVVLGIAGAALVAAA
jgi:hypothetical protein